VKYSREMRRIIYFEPYGFNPVVYGNRGYMSCHGLVLSSFRPIEVLVLNNLYMDLRRARVKKFVALKSSSNKRVVIAKDDRIISIYDREKLRRYTGKRATIPERIAMRLQTLFETDSRMFFADWVEVPSFLSENKQLILLALYHARSSIGMKMLYFDDCYLVEELIKKLSYEKGLLVVHDEALVYVPKPVPYIHYNDVRRALISLKYSFAGARISIEDIGDSEEEEIADMYGEVQDGAEYPF